MKRGGVVGGSLGGWGVVVGERVDFAYARSTDQLEGVGNSPKPFTVGDKWCILQDSTGQDRAG